MVWLAHKTDYHVGYETTDPPVSIHKRERRRYEAHALQGPPRDDSLHSDRGVPRRSGDENKEDILRV